MVSCHFVHKIGSPLKSQSPKRKKVLLLAAPMSMQARRGSSCFRPRKWIVERTFAWISRNRRLARDFERYATTVAAFIRLAMIRLMLRRLTRSTLCR